MILRHASKRPLATHRRPWATFSYTMREIAWNREVARLRLQEEDARRGGLAESSVLAASNPFSLIARFFSKTLTIAELEVRKLRHDFTELRTRAVQPILWLLLLRGRLARAAVSPLG